MIQVGISELRAKLSYYMRRVKAGERVTVTGRGKDIAVIVPAEQTDEEKALWNMVREGKGQWGGGKPQGMKKPVKVRGKPASQIVLEERR